MVSEMQKRIAIVVVATLIAVIILYPIETTVVPEWRIQTIDQSGRPISQVPLRQSWENYRIKAESYEEYTATDANGITTFRARTIKANLLRRIVRSISTLNLHGSPGPVATIHVLQPYASATTEAYYEPGKPLVNQIVVKLNR